MAKKQVAVREQESAFIESVVSINRVAKVVKGGRKFGFAAVVVVGDGDGRAGYGLGKAGEVAEAIRKGIAAAKKNMVEVPRKGTTIPYQVTGVFSGANIILKPASSGTGVIAGKAVRAVMNACGVADVLTKAIGSTNPANLIKATFKAVSDLRKMNERTMARDTGE